MTKTRTYPARDRTTLPIRGTAATYKAQLDFPSQLAVAWARKWLQTGPGAMGVDPLVSGVMRRALQVYISHLSDLNTDPLHEARCVRACGNASTYTEEAQQDAQERLQAHQPGQPMPTYQSVLQGPHEAQALDFRAIEARADELYEIVACSKWGRLHGLSRGQSLPNAKGQP